MQQMQIEDLHLDTDAELLSSLSIFPAKLFENVCMESISDDIVEALYAFAYSNYKIGKYHDTATLFRLLTGLRVRDSRFWKGLGSALQMLKNFEEAVEAYSWAAFLDEEQADPHPHFHAAECLHTLGQVGRGIKALDAAKIVASKNERKYMNLLQKIAFFRDAWSKSKKSKVKS